MEIEVNYKQLKEEQDYRFKKASADLAELKYREALGELISAKAALEVFKEEVLLLKNKLDSVDLPAKIAALTYFETDQKKIKSIVEKELKSALTSLSSLYKTPSQLTKEVSQMLGKPL